MKKTRATLAVLILALVASPVLANGSTEDLEINLRLNDDTYCPGGVMTGVEGAVEGREDNIQVTVVARSTIRRPVTLTSGIGVIRMKRVSDGKVFAIKGFPIAGTYRRRWTQLTGETVLRTPAEPGTYEVMASLGRTTRTRTTLEVSYDPKSCPGHQEPEPTPHPHPHGPGRNLEVTLRASWGCDDQGGVKDLLCRVWVKNTLKDRWIWVPGVDVHGIQDLDELELVNGELHNGGWAAPTGGWLAPGQAVVYQAHGWLENGQHHAVAVVRGKPAARDSSTLNVRCGGGGPDFGDIHGHFPVHPVEVQKIFVSPPAEHN